MKLPQGQISEWHTQRDDYDYRYHWIEQNKWWVEYRDKKRKEAIEGEVIKESE